MSDELSARLREAHDKAARCKQIEAMLSQMRLDKVALENNLQEYKDALAKEGLDVYKLETKSLSAFFHSAMGDLDETLKKERGEAMKARLKRDQAEKQLTELNTDMEGLNAEKERLLGCEEEYRRLYKQKMLELMNSDVALGERMMELAEAVVSSKIMLKNIREAIAAGEEAVRYVGNACWQLEKAKLWGVYDMAGNNSRGLGGVISQMRAGFEKHDHIESAAMNVNIAQISIDRFRSKLSALHIAWGDTGVGIEPSSCEKFADIFVDGLITDWYTQMHVNNSLHTVSMTKGDMENKLNMLKVLEIEEQRRLRDLRSSLDSIVVGGRKNRKLSSGIYGYIKS
jgi:hypothetical protein